MKFKLIYLIIFLLLFFLTLTSYSQNTFEVYENKGEDVKLEAIEKNGQILFKKTETGKIIINSEDEDKIQVKKEKIITEIEQPVVSEFFSAVSKKDLLIIKELIIKGQDVNTVLFEGNTALHLASLWGNVDMIELLIKNKANLKAKNNNGETPFHWVCKSGNISAFRAIAMNLKSVKDELNTQAKDGRTCLHQLALIPVKLDFLKYILTFNPNIKIKDKNNQSAQHFAAAYSQWGTLYELVRYNKLIFGEPDVDSVSAEQLLLKQADLTILKSFYSYLSKNNQEAVAPKLIQHLKF